MIIPERYLLHFNNKLYSTLFDVVILIIILCSYYKTTTIEGCSIDTESVVSSA